MAKASSKKKTKKSGLLALMIIASCIFFSGYMILFCAMMLPTLAAWIGDKDKSKRMAVTVGALNLTGTLPVLLELYHKGGQVGSAFGELAAPLNWIIVFLATLVGWVMAQVVPMAIASILTARDKMKLDKIRSYQKELVQEWGPEVTEVASLNRERL